MPAKYLNSFLCASTIILLIGCGPASKTTSSSSTSANTTRNAAKRPATTSGKAKTFVKPLDVDRNAVVKYAKTLLGTPYKYASATPSKGLDCSGFIYHVLGKFDIAAPRRSVDFTNEGMTVSVKQARPGDLILFTGSDNSSGIVGHMGFVTENKNGKLFFIHSASGKNIGVIVNEFKGYYVDHFVKVISIFE